MQKNEPFVALFPLGATLVTPGVQALVETGKIAPFELLQRHQSGDWGDGGLADQRSNEYSLRDGGRLLSSYRLEGGTWVWIITESDRSSTTILLPEEY